jgi:hypothetical protein
MAGPVTTSRMAFLTFPPIVLRTRGAPEYPAAGLTSHRLGSACGHGAALPEDVLPPW